MHLSTTRSLITAAVLSVSLVPALAMAQPPTVQHANGVSFISGGVGDESMAALSGMERQFNLKLFLVGQSGSYLSDIQVTISDRNGKGVLLTTSDGPVLLAKLPAGRYTVKAQKNGKTLEQRVSLTPEQLSTVYFRFSGE